MPSSRRVAAPGSTASLRTANQHRVLAVLRSGAEDHGEAAAAHTQAELARLTGLARHEAEALFLSGLPSALREMGLDDAASAARLKVSAALLPSLRDASRSAAQRFHLDAPGWYQEPVTPELLPAVAEARRLRGSRRVPDRRSPPRRQYPHVCIVR